MQHYPEVHMTGPQVLAWFGVTDMTLFRWLRDPRLNFPQPDLIINRRRYWLESRVKNWRPPSEASKKEAA